MVGAQGLAAVLPLLLRVVVVASLLLWRAAVSSGSVDNVEEFIVDLGFNDFQFHPDTMFQSIVTGGAIMVVVATFFAVLATLLFNLIADVTGGVRITMIEQRIPGKTTSDDLEYLGRNVDRSDHCDGTSGGRKPAGSSTQLRRNIGLGRLRCELNNGLSEADEHWASAPDPRRLDRPIGGPDVNHARDLSAGGETPLVSEANGDVGLAGLEPATSPLSGVRSNRTEL